MTGPPQPTVLVVDDEQSFVASLAHALDREGYRVLTAANGPDGLAIVAQERPDLVLLDLMLPGLPGLEVCRAIRAMPGPQPAIIMVTAKGSDYEAVVGLESGADDYVAKPFNLDLLLARVRAQLRRRWRPGSAPDDDGAPDALPGRISVGALVVDRRAYEARWDGRLLDLSPRLFELLAYLAQHPGKVVSRDELLNQVWGYEYAGQTRTVDVHVHWLREALRPVSGEMDLIQTIRGVGYKLAPPGPGGQGD